MVAAGFPFFLVARAYRPRLASLLALYIYFILLFYPPPSLPRSLLPYYQHHDRPRLLPPSLSLSAFAPSRIHSHVFFIYII